MTQTLLITDDSMIIREMIGDLAKVSGWQVVGTASNGQEAVAAFAELRPDMVTMDLVMPQFDGLYGLRGIRALDSNARVLIVSAIDQEAALEELRQAGAAGFVVKPFDKSKLQAALLRLFDEKSAANPRDAGAVVAGGRA